MKRLVPLLLFLIGFSSCLNGAGDLVLRTAFVPAEAVIGQRVLLRIDVLGKSGWAQIRDFPGFELQGAFIMRTETQGTRLQEVIDGDSYTGQRYEFSVFAQRAGLLKLSPQAVEVSVRTFGIEAGVTPQRVTLPECSLNSIAPPGAEGIRDLISTSELRVSQSWEPEVQNLEVGDVIKRTIEFEAKDVPGMAFPPLQYPPIDGIEIYPQEPTIQDSVERGALNGKRVETVSYVFEEEGTVYLPDFEVAWWQLDKEELITIKVSGFEVTILPPKALDQKIGEGSFPGNAQSKIVIILPVLILFLLFLIRKRLSGLYDLWIRKRSESEAAYFRRIIQATRQNDPMRTLRETMLWLDLINDNNSPARLDVFLETFGDIESRELVENFQSETDPDLEKFRKGMIAARKRWKSDKILSRKEMEKKALPDLN